MVGHDFHLYDVDVVFAADFLYEFLQAYIDTVDQDLAAVFWTPDYMILAGVHHIVIAFIFHDAGVKTSLLCMTNGKELEK